MSATNLLIRPNCEGDCLHSPDSGVNQYRRLRDESVNVPYHDPISMCTALSKTDTTVKFGHDEDTCLVNGEAIDRGDTDA